MTTTRDVMRAYDGKSGSCLLALGSFASQAEAMHAAADRTEKTDLPLSIRWELSKVETSEVTP